MEISSRFFALVQEKIKVSEKSGSRKIKEHRNLEFSGTSNFQRFFDQCAARVNAEFERSEADARQLSNSLDALSGLAQNISKRVAALDLGKSRVVECLQHVSDLRDLGTCANGVQQAIRDVNFEEAASHIHRFLTLDSIVFKMSDSQDVKGWWLR